MKKAAFVIALVLIACLALTASALSTVYTESATVIEIAEGEVIAVDSNGNEWAFFADGLTVGESITLVMDTNRTENVFDDSVIDCIF